MDVYLRSQTDITEWSYFFRIFGYDLCIPIWCLFEIPQKVLDNPTHMLEISKFFFSRGGEIPLERELSSDEEVANYLEAYRMVDLGHLYKCFGKIAAYYGEETAIHLLNFGETHFVGEVSRYWDDWHLLFLRQLRGQVDSSAFLDREVTKQILEIIEFHFEQEAAKTERFRVKFEEMCRSYSSKPIREREKLGQFLPIDIHHSNEEAPGSIADELESVFAFDLLLPQICAFGIWHSFNETCNEAVRIRFFEFAVQQLNLGAGGKDKNLKALQAEYLTL